jgi:hypothetical protein
LNLHGANAVKKTEINTSVPLVSEPSTFEFELVTEMLQSHKSPDIDEIPADLINLINSL